MKQVTALELKKKLEDHRVFLIDVREPLEHRRESIEGDHLIPLGDLSLERLPEIKGPCVMYCKMGKRSRDACEKLLGQDPSLDLAFLEGGILAWCQEGYPVKKSETRILPLDRQTQIAVGLITFTGTVLGTLMDPILYILPCFMGLGLMFAGTTGWCGMAIFLSKMPWNR